MFAFNATDLLADLTDRPINLWASTHSHPSVVLKATYQHAVFSIRDSLCLSLSLFLSLSV
eukprot:c16553_g1_i1 orf=1-177(-)